MKTDFHGDGIAMIITVIKMFSKRGFMMSYLSFSWQVLLELQLGHLETARPPNPSPHSSNKEDHCGKEMVEFAKITDLMQDNDE